VYSVNMCFCKVSLTEH